MYKAKAEIRHWDELRNREPLQHCILLHCFVTSHLCLVTYAISFSLRWDVETWPCQGQGLQLEKELEDESCEDFVNAQDFGSLPKLSVGLPAEALAVSSGQSQVYQL